MKVKLDLLQVPWHRYAVIAELAGRLGGRDTGVFGKTALQKYVYFLQELHGVDCGYEFTLYTYGPFSSELLGDLDVAEVMDGVEVEYLPRVNGYDIRPGTKAEKIRTRAGEFLDHARPAIDGLVDEFGGMLARDLELRAPLVYAARDASRRGPASEDALVNFVHGIKPRFTTAEIRAALHELREKGHVTTS